VSGSRSAIILPIRNTLLTRYTLVEWRLILNEGETLLRSSRMRGERKHSDSDSGLAHAAALSLSREAPGAAVPAPLSVLQHTQPPLLL
jgi:hypothetical protein